MKDATVFPSLPDTPAYRLLLDVDWSGTALGPTARWSHALRIALLLILRSPEPMYLIWGTERIFLFNDAYAPVLQDRLDTAMGMPMYELWADVRSDVSESIEAVFAGESRRFVDLPLHMLRGGQVRETFWTFSYSPISDEHGEVVGVLCITNEQTHRLEIEQWHDSELSTLNEALDEKKRDLASTEAQLRQAQKIEAIGHLTGGVAHDFNNLLTVITGSAELLRRPNLTDEKRDRYLSAISDTAARAAKLTGQLLAFARRQTLKPETFDLGASIEDVASIVRTLAGSRVTVDAVTPRETLYVLADRSQFDTAIVNMSVNARDAMDGEGKLTITAGSVSGIPEIRSHPPRAGDFVAITISDTGCGMPADELVRIFEPFYTTKGVGLGTGLGLSQVIGFAKQSDGDVRVDSTEGAGTSFTLYLPRALPGDVPVSEDLPESSIDGHGMCVLVVEDNESVGVFAADALDELGFNCIVAIDAAHALKELDRDHGRFNIVFSDVVMPGMSGIELAEVIRCRYPKLPVVLTSGYSHVLAENGSSGFELLHKPYSVEQLSRVLNKAVAWHGRTR